MLMDSDASLERFKKSFEDRIGTIGEDQTPVQINAVILSDEAENDVRVLFDLKPDHQQSLLVEWIPAGMHHVDAVNSGLTDEETIDLDSIPPRECWLQFPLVFDDCPVLYRRLSRLPQFDSKQASA